MAIVPKSRDVRQLTGVSGSKCLLTLGLPIRQEICKIESESSASLFHSHGLWLPANHWASSSARRQGVPSIIQPRGMLEPWALDYKASKKRIALALYQKRDLSSARILVATSEEEYCSFRKIGYQGPVAIIPNGVDQLPLGEKCSRQVGANETRYVLFLSRVHPKKGLIGLVQAWGRLSPSNWQLQLAGPDESGHLGDVMAEVGRLGLSGSVKYLGEVDGTEKSTLYRRADIFVLPTFSENFGVVVAEALAHGVPVITTRGTPWADLVSHECGWWIDIGVNPLVDALREAMALSDEQRWAMGERGRLYVRRYDWGDIAAQMAEVYRWVLGQASQPVCVRVD